MMLTIPQHVTPSQDYAIYLLQETYTQLKSTGVLPLLPIERALSFRNSLGSIFSNLQGIASAAPLLF